MDHARFGQQKRIRRLFAIVDARPDDLETSLCLELDDADFELLIQDHRRRRTDVVRSHDFRYALVEGPPENGFGCTIGDVCRREAQLDGVMSQKFACFLRHLLYLSSMPVGAGKSTFTHDVIIVFLAEHEAEFRMVVVGIFELGAEDHHHAVLEEIVEMNRIRVEPLTLEVMDPAERCQYNARSPY